MIVRRPAKGFRLGYTEIVRHIDNNAPDSMLLDFGLLRLQKNTTEYHRYHNNADTERAFLLLSGEVRFSYGHGAPRTHNRATDLQTTTRNDTTADTTTVSAQRANPFDDEPTALHLPAGVAVEIEVQSDTAELAIQQVANAAHFPPRILREGDYRSDLFGQGVLEGISTRRVCTLFDAATTPKSAMVMGEVLSPQGRWSSYPPHTHAHPEIYHFRFSPSHGFGYSEQGESVFKIEDEDTALIPPNVTHPQAAAPGYALFYVWSIPHLPDNRFGPDSRNFIDRHRWLL